jgi:hypothetical protein
MRREWKENDMDFMSIQSKYNLEIPSQLSLIFLAQENSCLKIMQEESF